MDSYRDGMKFIEAERQKVLDDTSEALNKYDYFITVLKEHMYDPHLQKELRGQANYYHTLYVKRRQELLERHSVKGSEKFNTFQITETCVDSPMAELPTWISQTQQPTTEPPASQASPTRQTGSSSLAGRPEALASASPVAALQRLIGLRARRYHHLRRQSVLHQLSHRLSLSGHLRQLQVFILRCHRC